MAESNSAPVVEGTRKPMISTASDDQPLTSRGRRTKAALVAAAREIFEQNGFQEGGIADITSLAGTAYGTFYTYFESKHDIMRELFTTVTGEMFAASRVAGDAGSDPWERIDAANRQYLAVHARNARLISVIDEMAPRDAFFRDLKLQIRDLFLRRNEDGIRRLQQRGLARPDIDPHITASVLGGMVEHFATMWFVYDVTFDEDLAINTLSKLWSSAIGVEGGPAPDKAT